MGQRLGQHFLIDPAIIDRIITTFAPKKGQTIIEIGPGRGALTHPLLDCLDELHAIELDPPLIAYLSSIQSACHLDLHHADVLKFDFHRFTAPLRIIGNLPYYLTTPLIFHLLEQANRIQDMYFMVQEEVAARLCAVPDDTIYGRLSVMVQYDCAVDYLFPVPPDSFAPPPAVESAVIRLRPHAQKPYPALERAQLSQLVALAFSQRRKMLRKSLQSIFSSEDWENMQIDGQQRPQSLGVEAFVRMANYLTQRQ